MTCVSSPRKIEWKLDGFAGKVGKEGNAPWATLSKT